MASPVPTVSFVSPKPAFTWHCPWWRRKHSVIQSRRLGLARASPWSHQMPGFRYKHWQSWWPYTSFLPMSWFEMYQIPNSMLMHPNLEPEIQAYFFFLFGVEEKRENISKHRGLCPTHLMQWLPLASQICSVNSAGLWPVDGKEWGRKRRSSLCQYWLHLPRKGSDSVAPSILSHFPSFSGRASLLTGGSFTAVCLVWGSPRNNSRASPWADLFAQSYPYCQRHWGCEKKWLRLENPHERFTFTEKGRDE